jgi:hypothetical protein
MASRWMAQLTLKSSRTSTRFFFSKPFPQQFDSFSFFLLLPSGQFAGIGQTMGWKVAIKFEKKKSDFPFLELLVLINFL